NEDDEGGERTAKLAWQDVLEDFSSIPSRFGEVVLLDTPPPPSIVEIADAVTVDGSQEALWQDVPAIELANTFTEEAVDSLDRSANWKSVWDNENLYFFISVLDDDLQNDSDQWYEDDGVEIYIDADNSKNATYGDNDYQITIGWNNDNLVADTKNNLGIGSIAAVTDSENGYNVEVAIPWTALGIEPENGNFLGIDVHMNDDDGGGSRSGKLAWFATADQSFRNPSTFGNAFLVADRPMPPDSGGAFGEVGNSTATHHWTKVVYSNVYENPVVVMGPIGTQGGQPTTVTVRNVGGTKFQWRIDEWEYLDGPHNLENASYIVAEAGSYRLENGKKIVAGKTRVTAAWKTVRFDEAFTEVPIILPQIINLKAKQARDVRVRNVTKTSFQMLVQGEEGKRGKVGSFKELVGYIAMEQGAGEMSGIGNFDIAKPAMAITNRNTDIRFERAFADDNRIFLGHDQTTNGTDPGTIRYRSGSLKANGARLFFQEEKSLDNEVAHVAEDFGYALFEVPGILIGTPLEGVEENDENQFAELLEIKMFPNPATNSIAIGISDYDGVEATEVVIFDLFGQEVLIERLESLGDDMDISWLTNGMYIVQIKHGDQTLRKLLVKR
ncbi:MAG: sugar-binding protein, partial [Pricia sp.]